MPASSPRVLEASVPAWITIYQVSGGTVRSKAAKTSGRHHPRERIISAVASSFDIEGR